MWCVYLREIIKKYICIIEWYMLATAVSIQCCLLHVLILKSYNLQVIKNIKNVAGCRDTRTAKSKETRGMIEHNSEVYNHPYRYMYNEKRYVGVIVYFTVMFDHPSCFLTFGRSGIPTSCYIFNVFYYLFTRGNRTPGSHG